MHSDRELGRGGEDLLKTVLLLSRKNYFVRSVDVAAALGVNKSTISVGVKKLESKGYLKKSDGRSLVLTAKGLQVAEDLVKKHGLLRKLLTDAGVDGDAAEKEACAMEHGISTQTYEILKKKIEEA